MARSPVATCKTPGVTGFHAGAGVSVPSMGEAASLIWNFYLGVAASGTVKAECMSFMIMPLYALYDYGTVLGRCI